MARGSSVVLVGSLYSSLGAAHAPAYAASKGGVVQLAKSLALAWARDGIRVNALAPGWIATTFTEPLRADPARNAEILARTPLGRWGTPDDVVGPALFLLSDAAAFVTGAVLPVDGGWLSA
jgi:NAD(P)-dependent dehydrogenase (short-subunit alcohol dehydrogenase family)